MMIYKCITVLLLVLLPSLGLAQNSQPDQAKQEQELQIQYLNQLIGTTLKYSPVSMKLYDFIFDWIGKPYRYGGESKNGIDCSAFTRELYSKVMGEFLPRNSRQQFKYVKSVPKNQLKAGDLVFFKIKSKSISHVGVYLGKNKFIQSSKSGVNVASLENSYWKRYYYKSGRLDDFEIE